MIKIKRVYGEPEEDDGYRVLVDRLWPRGLSKTKAKIDLWLREIAPSDQLRKWYKHDTSKWDEFKKRYYQELKEKKEAVEKLKELEKEKKVVTLLFSSSEQRYNNAYALFEFLSNA